MMINALNSGAAVFMADFEDALSPPWANVVGGQVNCMDAVRRTLEYREPRGQALPARPSSSPRWSCARAGWHLEEKHFLVDGRPVSASLFDFGLYFFHNARELLARGSGPYFYLPKLESHLEARLWNEVFDAAQEALGIPRGTIRATVLIETILAAFEMDEILYELRRPRGRPQRRPLGLHLQHHQELRRPARVHAARPVPAHDGGSVHARRTPSCWCRPATGAARTRSAAWRRSSRQPAGPGGESPTRWPGCGRTRAARRARDTTAPGWPIPTWCPWCSEVFDKALGDRPHQKDRQREEVWVKRERLLDVRVPGGRITEPACGANVSVALQYLEAWLRGSAPSPSTT